MPFEPAPSRAAGDRDPVTRSRGLRNPVLAAVLDFLVPSRCAGCGRDRREAGGGGVCRDCWERIDAPPEPACDVCALPGRSPCARCAHGPRPFERTAAVGTYDGPLAGAIAAFKFRGWDLFAVPAAQRMAAVAGRKGLLRADAVVPVPSTRRRNRERGFDPAVLLARETARALRLPFRRLLVRRGVAAPQSGLPATRRAANVAGAFRAGAEARGLRLLLVDDVLTTGATVSAAAGALRAAGAAHVDVLVLARTPAPDGPAPPENP